MTDNRTTTDGTPPTPGFEDSPTPGPYRQDGQATKYWVLKPEELAKGFVRPVRHAYIHVGPPGPTFPLRNLTAEEQERYQRFGYVKFEQYPEGSDINGKFWTQERLYKVDKGCGTRTTMANSIAETYARDPRFYGSTYCCGCGTHLPVGADGEFVWDGYEGDPRPYKERVGT